MRVLFTVTEFAAKHGVSRQRINELLREGRITGAQLHGAAVGKGLWLIPENAVIKRRKITKRSK